MGMGLDNLIHCAFHVFCFNMQHDCVLCVIRKIYMVKCMEKEEH